MTQMERIRRMEQYLDEASTAVAELFAALNRYADVQDKLQALADYYDGGAWLEDYEADEAGKLPKGLKRGVLSQDALYDLLSDHRELLLRMAEIAKAQSFSND